LVIDAGASRAASAGQDPRWQSGVLGFVNFAPALPIPIAMRIRRYLVVVGLAVGLSGVAGTATQAAGPPGAPRFIPLGARGELREAVTLAAAAPLPSGDVLIAGGAFPPTRVNPFNFTTRAQLFDASTDTFRWVASRMSTARDQPAAAALPGGRVLMAGGEGTADPPLLNSAEVYNAKTGRFNPVAARLPDACLGSVAASLPDGDVLIAGGDCGGALAVSNRAAVFDPSSGRFRALSARLNTPRMGAIAATLPGGDVLIAGGTTVNSNRPLSSAEIFAPATGRFQPLRAHLAIPIWDGMAASLKDGDVLIVGGLTATGETSRGELFDPRTETFTLLNARLAQPTSCAVAAPLPNGDALIAGGQTGVENRRLRTAEIFQP
jgi:hypothetical protein